jgi:membrane protease YdiL (CAAX protease family)
VEPSAPLTTTADERRQAGASAVRRLWAWVTDGPAYPASADDARSVSILGVRLPVRATLAILIVSTLVLLDHGGRFLGFFWDGQGSNVEMLRARAISRGVVLGFGALLVIVLVLRDAPDRYGLRLGDARAGLAFAVVGGAVMTPIVLAAAMVPDFRSYYIPAAQTTPLNVVLTTAFEVIPVELFFRGLLMFALLRVVGPLGILVATLPFAFAHIGKPEIETLSTLAGGFAYGWLDWRTGSVLWSGMAHTYILSLAILVSGALGAS